MRYLPTFFCMAALAMAAGTALGDDTPSDVASPPTRQMPPRVGGRRPDPLNPSALPEPPKTVQVQPSAQQIAPPQQQRKDVDPMADATWRGCVNGKVILSSKATGMRFLADPSEAGLIGKYSGCGSAK